MKTKGYCPCCGHPSEGICEECTTSLREQRDDLRGKPPTNRANWERARIRDIDRMIGRAPRKGVSVR